MWDSFRRGRKRAHHKLLLALSYGVSSSVLLRTLNSHIEYQTSKPYPPMTYELHVLAVETPISLSLDPNLGERSKLVQEAFPRYSYAQMPMHSIFEYDAEFGQVMAELSAGYVDNPSLPNKDRLEAFCASMSTSTSRVDVEETVLRRLVVAYAKKLGCGAVMWGDSDSSLAAKTLACVAKGRARSLTWQLSDGMSPWGVAFHFPLRDFFKTEVIDYARLVPDLNSFIIPEVPLSDTVLTKNLSIDELMTRYVTSQAEKYPSVIGNVARMVTKLDHAPTAMDIALQCKFCGTFMGVLDGKSGDVDDGALEDSSQSYPFCYGCARSRQDTIKHR